MKYCSWFLWVISPFFPLEKLTVIIFTNLSSCSPFLAILLHTRWIIKLHHRGEAEHHSLTLCHGEQYYLLIWYLPIRGWGSLLMGSARGSKRLLISWLCNLPSITEKCCCSGTRHKLSCCLFLIHGKLNRTQTAHEIRTVPWSWFFFQIEKSE